MLDISIKATIQAFNTHNKPVFPNDIIPIIK